MTKQSDLAQTARLSTSSSLNASYPVTNLTDGKLTNESRWVSGSTGPHTVTLTWPTPQTIGCVQLGTGWLTDGAWGSAFQSVTVRDRAGRAWASVAENSKAVVELRGEKPLTTDQLQLVFADPSTVRLVEVRVFAPAASYPPLVLPGETPRARPVPLFLNQTGYDPDAPKRFTAPTLPEGTPFVVKQGERTLFRGTIRGNVGDFTPLKAKGEVRIEAAGLVSDPFEISSLVTLRASLDPALRFFVDNRSLVGTHPSAYGGSAWRDGTYYSYEVPSLVMLYLANPSFFDQAPREVVWKPLPADFKPVKANGDSGALEAAHAYFREIEPPKPDAPDLVKLIHWGVGWHLVKPESADPSGDPKGKRLHPQTVEQLAFFLYAWPQLSRWLPESLYTKAKAFVLSHWYFGIQTEVGDFKGRECPGHSILPNLLLYNITQEKRFLDTALAQARWVCTQLDPADPKVTKGQRMSEHLLLTGLTTLLTSPLAPKNLSPNPSPGRSFLTRKGESKGIAPPSTATKDGYPLGAGEGAGGRGWEERLVAQIRTWLEKWSTVMLARSENAYDFRKYDETYWTLPRFTPGSHGGAGWNEPGNVAGFPACALAVARLTPDQKRATRLRVIATAHFDALFGRNPLGAHAAYRGPKDFYGVERGWPKKFTDDTCARLELVRGTLSSTAATEHYPNNPEAPFRHPEGWTAFNAAFNVGLAYACRDATRLTRKGKTITLQAPIFAPTATVTVGKTTVVLKAVNPEQTRFEGTTSATGTLRYGHGFLATETS